MINKIRLYHLTGLQPNIYLPTLFLNPQSFYQPFFQHVCPLRMWIFCKFLNHFWHWFCCINRTTIIGFKETRNLFAENKHVEDVALQHLWLAPEANPQKPEENRQHITKNARYKSVGFMLGLCWIFCDNKLIINWIIKKNFLKKCKSID